MEPSSTGQKGKKQAHAPQQQAASSSDDRLNWNVYDPRLLPKFLLNVLDAHLPAGESPTPRALSALANDVQKHGLLQVDESSVPAIAPAFAAWRKRVDALLASKKASDQWAAASLVALTAQAASLALFADASLMWLPALAGMLKPSSGSDALHSAVCKAVGATLHRLAAIVAGGAQALYRTHSATASKVVSTLAQQLPTATDAQFGALLEVLSGVLAAFPASLKPHVALLEESLVTRMMAEGKRPRLQMACASCLSQLPRIQGDASAWMMLVRKIMLALHTECRVAFAGMEHASQHDAAVAQLAPQGSAEGTPELAGYSPPARLADGRLPALLPRITALLASLKGCMARSLRFAVPLPCHLVLGLTSRILSVDGSAVRADPFAPQGSSAGGGRGNLLGAADPKHRFATWEALPVLHLEALSLLEALLHAAKRHLLPHSGFIARLLADCLRRCGTPSLAHTSQGTGTVRERLYQTTQAMLAGLGSGFALQLAAPLVTQVLRDLSVAASQGGQRVPSTVGGDTGGDAGGKKNKRKGGAQGSASDYTLASSSSGGSGISGGEGTGGVTLGVQKEALATINLLLVTAGSLVPERFRALLDAAVARAALASASQLASRREEDATCGGAAGWWAPTERVCLAAHQALLSSVTVPRAHTSAPFLTTALRLFQRGRSEGSPALSTFCVSAIAALEAILHPRAAPRRVPPPLFPEDLDDEGGAMGGSNSGGGAHKRARLGTDASPWEEVEEVLDAHRAGARVPGVRSAGDDEADDMDADESDGCRGKAVKPAAHSGAAARVPAVPASVGGVPGPAQGGGRATEGSKGLDGNAALGKQGGGRPAGAAGTRDPVGAAGDAALASGGEGRVGGSAGKSGPVGKFGDSKVASASAADRVQQGDVGGGESRGKNKGRTNGPEATSTQLPGGLGDDSEGKSGKVPGASLGIGLHAEHGAAAGNLDSGAAAARPLPAVGMDDDSEVDSEGSLPSIVEDDDEDDE
eukprot:jgi/Mesvir1/28296/Mv04817-RA.1